MIVQQLYFITLKSFNFSTCQVSNKINITYVFVFEEAEHLQLPEDPFATHEALKDVRQFLQGHSPTVPWIRYRPVNHKIRTLPTIAERGYY